MLFTNINNPHCVHVVSIIDEGGFNKYEFRPTLELRPS
jgi:hypothetical protein